MERGELSKTVTSKDVSGAQWTAAWVTVISSVQPCFSYLWSTRRLAAGRVVDQDPRRSTMILKTRDPHARHTIHAANGPHLPR